MDGDIAQAFQWLRKRGIAKATSMADRSANEGKKKLVLALPPRSCKISPFASLVHAFGRRGGRSSRLVLCDSCFFYPGV